MRKTIKHFFWDKYHVWMQIISNPLQWSPLWSLSCSINHWLTVLDKSERGASWNSDEYAITRSSSRPIPSNYCIYDIWSKYLIMHLRVGSCRSFSQVGTRVNMQSRDHSQGHCQLYIGNISRQLQTIMRKNIFSLIFAAFSKWIFVSMIYFYLFTGITCWFGEVIPEYLNMINV